MRDDMARQLAEIRANPRPGMINAVSNAQIVGGTPPDLELLGVISLIIGGGFDTTTALTSRSLEWLSLHPDERARLSADRDTLLNSATEEFLRYFTPAPGNGRTISADCEIAGQEFHEGERLYLSWAMSNRDPAVFDHPNEVELDRTGNRHHSIGLGLHRCIGSNVARMVFKRVLLAVLDRMPDYVCDPAGAVHYETIGIIQGMKHLPATFTPGSRVGDGLNETLARLQLMINEQRLADPVTRQGAAEGHSRRHRGRDRPRRGPALSQRRAGGRRRAGRANAARAGDPRARRPGVVGRRDRRAAVHQPGHREDARQPDHDQARCP
jgi:Cytochrome P450